MIRNYYELDGRCTLRFATFTFASFKSALVNDLINRRESHKELQTDISF